VILPGKIYSNFSSFILVASIKVTQATNYAYAKAIKPNFLSTVKINTSAGTPINKPIQKALLNASPTTIFSRV